MCDNITAAYNAYFKARDDIGGAYPEGEEAISRSAEYSYLYAKNVLKGRFKAGEKAIRKSAQFQAKYLEEFPPHTPNEFI